VRLYVFICKNRKQIARGQKKLHAIKVGSGDLLEHVKFQRREMCGFHAPGGRKLGVICSL
jgi:hypothetical protein